MSSHDLPQMGSTPAAEANAPSIGELFGRLTEQVSRLVRAEFDLAKAEMIKKVTGLGIGAGLLVAAGVLSLYGLGVLIAAAVLGIANVVSPWLAALIVGFAILLIVGVLALIGIKSIKASTPLQPQQSIDNLKESVDTIKEGLRS